MAKIESVFKSFSMTTGELEPTENTWRELRDTFAYFKDRKLPIVIERVSENAINLGVFHDEARTYINICLKVSADE